MRSSLSGRRHEPMAAGWLAVCKEWGERLDNDPSGTRYGCFLPDLTGLARRSPAPTSRGLDMRRRGGMQACLDALQVQSQLQEPVRGQPDGFDGPAQAVDLGRGGGAGLEQD